MTTRGDSVPDDSFWNLLVAEAMNALALCRSGAVRDGIDSYRQVLKAEYDLRRNLPVALHLKFLESEGLNDAAGAIRLAAVLAGQNLCLKAGFGKPADEVVAEYRELFAKGIINSNMVEDYLVELSKLGETGELASFLDVERFVQVVDILMSDADVPGKMFWESLATKLLEERSDRFWRESVQSVRGMHLVPRIDKYGDGRIQRALAEIGRHVRSYLADLRSDSRGAVAWIPQKYRIVPWALLSSGYGYNVPHIHNQGSITGVLYVAGPDEIGPNGEPVGALRIGPSETAASAVGWPDFAVAPKPGRLVIFPSYFTHWTVPLGKPAQRISIAFDVIDSRAIGDD
jgi:hypothetical protein